MQTYLSLASIPFLNCGRRHLTTPQLSVASLLEEELPAIELPPIVDSVYRVATSLLGLVLVWTGMVALAVAFFLALAHRWDTSTLMYTLGGLMLVALGILVYR